MPLFKVVWDPPALQADTTFDAGGWGACLPCAKAVESGDVQTLVQRAVRVQQLRGWPEGATPVLRRHFLPIFEHILRLKTARKTPAEVRDLQGYADEPIGITWDAHGMSPIMPNTPLDAELGLG